jgi:hypothetical protein
VGEAQGTQGYLFEPGFNRAVKVRVGDDRITSDSGVILLRETDHRLGLLESLAARMTDARDPERIRYTLVELLRQRIYALALGYAAQDDLDRLAHDPAFRPAVWDRPGDRTLDERLSSQPTQSRLLDELSGHPENLEALRAALADWVERALRSSGTDRAAAAGALDLDSFPIEVHGGQAGGAFNGHYLTKIYHPLVASFCVGGDYDHGRDGPRFGDGFVHAVLRAGNVSSRQGTLRFLRNVMDKCAGLARVLDVRMDAGFTVGEIMDELVERCVRFLGRLKTNAVLERLAQPHLTRRVGRPPSEGYEFTVELGMHRAATWKHAQRVILVVQDRPDPATGQLGLFPHHFFLVTNRGERELSADAALAHYRKRGTAEDRFGEFRQAIGPHLSSPEFRENEATLLLAMLAFNLAGMLRGQLEDEMGGCWDLNRFVQTVLKAGGRVVKHARGICLHVARAAAGLWGELLTRIRRWTLPDRYPAAARPKPRPWQPPPSHAHRNLVLRW